MEIINNFKKGMVTDLTALDQVKETYLFSLNGRLSQVGDLFVWTNEQGIGKEFALPSGFICIGGCEYIDKYLFLFIWHPVSLQGGFCTFDAETETFSIKQWSGPPSGDMLTTLFNFPPYTMVECFARGDVNGSINIYFTDNFNPIRVINTEKLYNISNFGQMNLVPDTIFPQNTNGVGDSSIVVQTGGNLISGNYLYLFRYRDEFFNITNWSDVVGTAVIGEGVVGFGNDFTVFEGGKRPGDITNKKVSISLNNIDPSYKYVEIAFVWFNGQSAEVKLIQKLPYFGTSFNYEHLETNSINFVNLSLDSLSAELKNFVSKTITTIDNRLFAANNKYSIVPELQTVAKNLVIDYDINESEIEINGLKFRDDAAINYSANLAANQEYNTYKDAEKAGKKVGYWRDEVYQFGISFQFKDGSWSQVYPIGNYRDWKESSLVSGIKTTKYSATTGALITGTYRMPPRYLNKQSGDITNGDVYYYDNGSGSLINRKGEPLYTTDDFGEPTDVLHSRILYPIFVSKTYYSGYIPEPDYVEPYTLLQQLIDDGIISGYSFVRSNRIKNIQYSCFGWGGVTIDGFTRPFPRIEFYDDILIPPDYGVPTNQNSLFFWSSDYVLTADTPNTSFTSLIPQGDRQIIKVVDTASYYNKVTPLGTIKTIYFDYYNNDGISDTDFAYFNVFWDNTYKFLANYAYYSLNRYIHEKQTLETLNFSRFGNVIDLGVDDEILQENVYFFGNSDPVLWKEDGANTRNYFQGIYQRNPVDPAISGISIVLPSFYIISDDPVYNESSGDYLKVYYANICKADIDFKDLSIYYPLPANQRYFFCNHFKKETPFFKRDEIYNGDCYINRNVFKLFYPINVWTGVGGADTECSAFSRVYSFITENNQNHVFRYDDFGDEQSIYGGNPNGINMQGFLKSTPEPLSHSVAYPYLNRKEALFYNQGNHQNLGGKFLTGFDETNPVLDQRYPVRINYSEKDLYDSLQDLFRIFLVGNYRDYDITRGEINKLVELNNQLISVQDMGINLHIVNERAVFSESNNLALKLGAGDVLVERPQYVSTELGSRHQWSVFKSLNSVYGVHRKANRTVIWKYNGDQGLLEISTIGLIRNWINDNVNKKYLGNYDYLEDTPLLYKGIVGGYNKKTLDCYFTFLNDREESVNIMFSEISNSFIGQQGYCPTMYLGIANKTLVTNDSIEKGQTLNQVYSLNNTGLNNSVLASLYYFDPQNLISEPGILKENKLSFYATIKHMMNINPQRSGENLSEKNTIATFDYFNIVSNNIKPLIIEQENSFQSGAITLSSWQIRYLERLWRAAFGRNTTTKSRFRDNYLKITLTYSLSKEESIKLQEFISIIRKSYQ